MRRVERRVATLLLAAMIGSAHAYKVDYRWPQPTRNVQLAFTGTSPSGRSWVSTAREMMATWKEVTGFTFVQVPGHPTGCVEDDVSTIQFSQRVCGLNFDPGVLTLTRSVSRNTGNNPIRRVDSDAFINTGPGTEGHAINFRWPQATRILNNRVEGTSPSGTTYAAALDEAARHWNQKTPFTFTVNTTDADPCDSDYTTTAIRFAPMACRSDFPQWALAVTRWRSRVSNNIVYGTAADMLFNSAIDWDVYDGPLNDSTDDFRRVAVHELGHVIGLEHSSMEDAIMWPVVHDGYETTCDDWRGMAVAYHLDPDTICEPPSVRPPWFEWKIFRGALPFEPNDQAEFRRAIGAILGFVAGLQNSDVDDSLVHLHISNIEYPTCDDQAGLRFLYGNPAPCKDLSSTLYRDGFE